MPTNLYGPGDNYHLTNSHVLPTLIRRFYEAVNINSPSVTCWGSGSALRQFLHSDDLGEACVFALERWQPLPGEITYLNVGTGVDQSIRDVAVASAIGYKGKIEWDISKPDGTPKKQLDVSRLIEIGWHPRINFAEGLKSTILHFRQETKQGLIRL